MLELCRWDEEEARRRRTVFAQLIASQGVWKGGRGNAKQLTGVPFSEVKLSLLLNLERQSSFLGTWKAEGPPGGGAKAELGEGRRSPWAAALRSGAPAAASSLDCTARPANCALTDKHSRNGHYVNAGRDLDQEPTTESMST